MKFDFEMYELIESCSKGMRGFLVAAILITVALLIRLDLWPVDYGLQYVTFFPAVALTAVIAGFWPGIFSMSTGLIFATFILTKPYYSISLDALHNSLLSNTVFTLDGLLVCISIESMHKYRKRFARQLEISSADHAASERTRMQLKNIFDNVLDGIVSIDTYGNIETFNVAASEIFGYSENEVIGKNVSILMPEPYRSQHDGFMHEYQVTGNKKVIGFWREMRGKRKDGAVFPLELSVCEIGDEGKFTGILRDITERKARDERIHHLAHHDPLTGMPNRNLLFDRLQQQIAKAKRDGTKVAVMFIDLDHFKSINDGYGHDIGDGLLREASARIAKCLREADTAARMGGDEFIVLLPSIEMEKHAELVAEKIRQALSQPVVLAEVTLNITSSIGIALFPDHGSGEILLKHADIAMYCAKGKGRNRIEVYCQGMKQSDAS